ncbi:MAG TPA: M28 family peptidase [Bacteroidota bacterium]|nr:M28 family peptidase [Bacteroidota bacterium]
MTILLYTFLFMFQTQAVEPAPEPRTPFSLDSAVTYLRAFSVEISSRPMGSPSEQRAMEYAVGKFKEFGLSEATVMPMRSAQSYSAGGLVNTNSGVAVGVLKGKSGRIIVIGAHIDSSEPEVPGANDDASGSAVVLELARVLAKRQNESTIVFALFGGEEQGLQGSKHFVRNFPNIDSVRLMLQVDMANGTGWILPLVDSKAGSSPEWLVKAAYEEFHNLGYTGLSFPTHLMTFSGMFGGAIGSDHVPFLERGIPAIDFTTDVNDPIHTPQDTYENFRVWGLQRSGDLVYRLVERFDNGIPEQTLSSYFLFDVGSEPFFIPEWLLWAFLVVATGLTIFVLSRNWKEPKPTPSPKYSGWKLFFFLLIIQTCVWLSENVVGLIKGDRFPWLADLTGYFALGFIAGCVGIWLSLRLSQRLRLSHWSVGYFLRSAVFLIVFSFLLLPLSIKAAIAPAFALLFLCLAYIVRPPILRLFFWLVSPHMMFRLIFSEGFELFARSFVLGSPRDISAGVIIHLIYILFFSLWAFPFLSAFAAIALKSRTNLLFLKSVRGRHGLAVSVVAFVALVGFLASRPSTSTLWQPNLTITQNINSETMENTIAIASTEYLGGTRISIGDMDTTFSKWATSATIRRRSTSTQQWIQAQHKLEADSVGSRSYRLLTRVHTQHRPYHLTVMYVASGKSLERFESPYEFSASTRSATLRWFSFPDTVVVIPASFDLAEGDTLTEQIEAVFPFPFEPVTIQGFAGNIKHRTIFSSSVRHFR